MPCIDGRERYYEAALAQHHRRLEALVERVLSDERVPEEYRRELAAEQARFKGDQSRAADGKWPKGHSEAGE